MPLRIVGVMGPGEQATEQDCHTAERLGELIAQSGWVLLTGGRNCGVMDAASRGAKRSGGLTIGILPSSNRTHLSAAVDIPIMTGLGHARNSINALSSDVVIACGMGLGTASEVALSLKVGKPVILLNASLESQSFFESLAREQIYAAADVDVAIVLVKKILQ